MAAHPPVPLPPDDGSGVYRKPSGKSSAHRRTPPPDDLSAEEPTDLVELTDDESMPIGELPTAASLRTDADLVIDQVLFDDEPLTEPLRAKELSEQPTDPEPPFPAAGREPGDEDSVVLSGRGVTPSHPGSGWYDPPPAPPSTGKFEDAAQLFADLRADAPESTTEWAPEQVTGRVSESDLFRAFDEAEAGTDVGRPHLSPHAPPPDNSDVFSVIPAGSGSLVDGSGINLTDPHTAPPSKPPDPELDPVSSIFAKGASDSSASARLDPDELPLLGSDDDLPLTSPAAGGSSIFDRAVGRPPRPSDPTLADEMEAVGFDLPEFSGDSGSLSQVSGRIDLSSPFDDPAASGASLSAEEDTAPRPTSAGEPTKPARGVMLAAGAIGAAGAKSRRTPAEPPVEDEDEPAAGFGRSKGLGKFVGGAAFGLLASGITFAALYLGGVIPNAKKETVAPVVGKPSADPEAVAKLGELQKQFDTAKEEAVALKQKGDAADVEVKKLQAMLKDGAGADGLKAELAKAKDDAEKARATLIIAKNDADAAKKEAETATAAVTTAKKDLETLKANIEDVKKTAITDAEKLMTALKTELEVAKKIATNREKQVLDLEKSRFETEAALADARAKQREVNDSLAGLVKEFKSAKLLAEGDDVSKLPEAVKRLVATATSTDAKKAADALLAAQKELDTANAKVVKTLDELDTAKTAKAKAELLMKEQKTEADKQLATQKTEADKLVADAQKSVDDKVKVAVVDATKVSQKQLDDATAAAKKATDDLATAKATAKAEVEATAKTAIDAATAKANTAEATRVEAQKTYEQKLADQATQFAARLADARSGAAVPVTSVETAALEKASKSYADGMTLFLAGRYADAEPLFQAAATNGSDARHWYFLGLTQYQLGRQTEAVAAFKKGAVLEARNKPGQKAVGESLERVQSYLRRVLAEHRP